MAKQKQIRRAQTIAPFGVGAIFDIEGESLVAVDVSRWKGQGQDIREPRLEVLMGVSKFKMAPAAPEDSHQGPGHSVPFMRFPRWLFCTNCRRMKRWHPEDENELSNSNPLPKCQTCGKGVKLTPMRFVMACPRGHLADVPWDYWVHFQAKDKNCKSDKLAFLTRPGGSGLDFLVVKCEACKAERTLEGIASPDKLKELNIRCTGKQPWQSTDDKEACHAIPQVVQRGATNLTFSNIMSSIDIPPFSNWEGYSSDTIRVTNHINYPIIRSSITNPVAEILIGQVAIDLDLSEEGVRRIIENEIRLEGGESENQLGNFESNLDELLYDEYQAFLAPDVEGHPRDRFVKRMVVVTDYVNRTPPDSYGDAVRLLNKSIQDAVQITRLREVRVLRGFSRLSPVGFTEDEDLPGKFSQYDNQPAIGPSLVQASLIPLDPAWLPAIEVFGEGIFLRLNEEAVVAWEEQKAVKKRAAKLLDRYERGHMEYLPPPTPRMILLHTLAHLLIRQLSFECGYAIASLRERIYSAEPKTGKSLAGLLIYTAAGDSEGTLGGLVREGEAARLFPALIKALQQAEWCSSDPLCRESDGQGSGSMNLAACHACTLLPETSCTVSNRMLDRMLVLGSNKTPSLGFFSTLMSHLISSMDEERVEKLS